MYNRKKAEETKAETKEAVKAEKEKDAITKRAIARGGRSWGLFLSMALLMAAVTGCGSAGDDVGASPIEIIPVGEQEADAAGDESSKQEQDEEMSEPGMADGVTGNSEGADTGQLLYGTVRSIGENGIVVSEAFEESDNEEPDASVLVAPDEGSPEEILIQVNFSDDTVFEVKTVKNGGVNGDSDVETKTGSIADLKEQDIVDLTGDYEGGEFYAKKVFIYRFV